MQAKLRNMTDEEIQVASKSISNHANNPSSPPYTASEDSLPFIDDQNVHTSKRGKIDSYAVLWGMLGDVTEPFIQKFSKCFKTFVDDEHPILYGEV